MAESQNIILLGSTAPTGIATAKEALKRGHKLTLYVRNPGKLPEEIAKHADVKVVEGQLDDLAPLLPHLPGIQVVVSVLGPVIGSTKTSGHLFANFYRALLPHLKSNNIKRIYVCSTPSLHVEEDKFQLSMALGVLTIRTIASNAYAEIQSVKSLFFSPESAKEWEGIEWTIFRITYLKNSDSQEIGAGYVGDGKWGMAVERPGIGRWLVDRVEDGGKEWVGKAPALYSYGKKA